MAKHGPVIIGYGGNLAGEFGTPRSACGAALLMLAARGARVAKRSPWYESAPVPMSDQPWYVNGAATVTTELSPEDLMALLLDVESRLGRERGEPNAARIIDLDILAYGDEINEETENPPLLPHPRMHKRAFTVLPIRDILPAWHHPILNKSIEDLAAELPSDQEIHVMDDTSGIYGTEWMQQVY